LKDLIEGDEMIYVSFGTQLQASKMPKEKIDALLNAFSSFKYKFLWKYDGDLPAKVPNNVILQKWLPQNDIIGNKMTMVFITNGKIKLLPFIF
jgi:glucuronosyltransferase